MTYDFSLLSFDALILIGALVHLERELLPQVLESMSRALSEDGLLFLTLKEGCEIQLGSDGRSFTLWQQPDVESVFSVSGLRVEHFSRQTSRLRKTDIWLSYLLRFLPV